VGQASVVTDMKRYKIYHHGVHRVKRIEVNVARKTEASMYYTVLTYKYGRGK
jgi:hypothetical protein